MPNPIRSQIEKWKSMPVIVTGVPSAAAVGVVMASIEKFVVGELTLTPSLSLQGDGEVAEAV